MKTLKRLITALMLLNLTAAFAVNKGVTFVNPDGEGALKTVTQIEKMKVLSNLHIPKAVVVGLMDDVDISWHDKNTKFVVDLYEIIYNINEVSGLEVKTSGHNQNIDVVVVGAEKQRLDLISRIQNRIGGDALKHFKFIDTTGVIPMDGYYGLLLDRWMQDWGEFVGYGRTASGEMVHGIFYVNRNRGLKEVVQKIARVLDIHFITSASDAGHAGDYGGNIEITPDGILFHGDTMDERQVNQFMELGQEDQIVELWTSWLGVGHVDEMFSVISSKHRSVYPLGHTGPRPNYSFLVADPAMGLEAIYNYQGDQETISYASDEKSSPETIYDIEKIKQVIHYFVEQGGTFESCQQETNFEFKYCDLVDFNYLVSQQVIEPNIASISGKTPTINDDFIRIPQIYRPTYQYNPATGEYAFAGAVSFLPGTANLVSLRDHLIVPEPTFDIYKEMISEIVGPRIGGANKIHYIMEKKEYHDNWGEVHCGTNVMRDINLYFKQ